MALVFTAFEGFDDYANDAEVQAAYGAAMGTNSVLDASEVPFGYGKCLKTTNDLSRRGFKATLRPTNSEGVVHYLSGRFRSNTTLLSGSGSSESTLLGMHVDGGTSINFYNYLGLFYAYATNAVKVCMYPWSYDTLSVDLQDDAWHTMEVMFYQANSNGWGQIYIDDALVWYNSGQDTSYNAVQLGNNFGGYGAQAYYDDVIYGYDDTNTSYPGDDTEWSSRPGDGDLVVYPVNVDGDNGTNQFTSTGGSHYTEVDETTPDDDTTKLTATATGQTEEFTLESLPANVTALHAVFARARAAAETADTLSETLTLFTKSGGSSTDHISLKFTGDTWQWMAWQDVSIDPATAALWTIGNFNSNAVLGVKT